MEPTNTRVRLLELVNAVRRLPNSNASEHVRRATVALAEAMQVDGLTAASVRGDASPDRNGVRDLRENRHSALPDALKARIETTTVRWQEQDYALLVTKVVPYPAPPLNRIALDVTVRTRHGGRDVGVTCRVRLQHLQATEQTADRIAGAVRSALEDKVTPADIVVL